MAVTRERAYTILEVNRGSSQDEIRAAYKKQALKWHPDKHKNSPEATQRFQEISSAYERLMKPEEVEIHLSMDEMFDLFSHVFFGHRVYRNGYFDSSDSDGGSDNFSYRPETFKERSREKEVPKETRPTVSEAKQHEAELLREEEKQKRQKEKRKERKKRRKARKRQEKEIRYGGGDGKKKGKKQVVQESSDDEDDEEDENEDIENKENIEEPIKENNSSGHSPVNSQDMSSMTKNFNNDTNVEQTKPEIHKDNDSSHRKEIHDGECGGNQPREERKTTQNRNKMSDANTNMAESLDTDSDEETQGLDMNSAFFARAASGVSKKQAAQPAKKEKSKKSKGGKKDESESIEDMHPTVLESRKLAVKGNEMANTGSYQAAVKFFTKAIDLNPTDFRFFGNRSFCFDHLQMYDHALQDAEQAISLDKSWPKGYYRKGRALSGLKLYTDAEAAFEDVLRLDKNCAEAVHELRTVRVYRLMEMGFNAQRSEAAILQFGNVQAALENLLSQAAVPVHTELEEVYVSDEEDYITKTIEESKIDARNPQHLRSLWIGNLQPTVTEKELTDLFKPFGEVHSMRRMTEKYCAFVNYKDPRMASKAMDKLQGKELHGKFLLIKFPDNPIDQVQTGHHGEVDTRYKTTVLRKNQPTTGNKQQKNQQNNDKNHEIEIDPESKLTGPVNGDECFFWRTTGCWYGERCFYKHLPQSKGLDRK